MSTSPVIIPVILCGGSGTRLWPVSRQKQPKQFLKLLGDHSLLQETVNRALRVSGSTAGHVVTVTLDDLRDDIIQQYKELDADLCAHVLGETEARNTAAAVALAAVYVEKTFGADAVMWILPADHHVGDEAALKASLDHAVETAANGYLVTFGIRPSRPETGYGYIKSGDPIKGHDVLKIGRFVEKPNVEKAAEFLRAGDYFWNSGMFVFTAGSVLEAYQSYSADILDLVEQSLDMSETQASVDSALYAKVKKEPFDIAIMEKADKAAVVPSNPAWSDIGSWESLWEIHDKDEDGNAVKGDTILKKCENVFVRAESRLVAGIGLKNMVIVETKDAILVADISDSDTLKAIVNEMKDLNRSELVEPV